MQTEKQVLAIQSHVVHGYVGNKSATLPLQIRGWDVDCLNAVQFSNHTGYGHVEGYKLSGSQIKNIYEGLRAQEFEYQALLTGYLPSAEAVEAVFEVGTQMKSTNKDMIWLLDPVMGDEGRLYVKEDVIPVYKKILKSGLVTLITPNHFEVEVLTGIQLNSKENVIKALDFMHREYNIEHIVISSVPHATDNTILLTIGSTINEKPFVIRQSKIQSYFTGTGDLFAALLLDSVHRYGLSNLAIATTRAISIVSKTLKRTYEFGLSKNVPGCKMADKSMKFYELRLVQCIDIFSQIEHTDVKYEEYA
ncbi:putative pyridoxal kinase [Starmerella bacillaris]|uniref:pyridoxal kinase n=1 Tax=Starmerella bacillaris TaxID=1247836 RepID=A0AAV5RL81_STABA|nr:putative pyridoxal kinase [Starmerella bacillaris]